MTDVEQKALDKLESSIKATISVLALGRGVGSQASILNDLIEAKKNLVARTTPVKVAVPRKPAAKKTTAKKRSSI